MRRILIPVVALAVLIFMGTGSVRGMGGPVPQLLDGDILFQRTRSGQAKAISLATHSPYTHTGILFYRKGKPFVFEAVQPVKLTPLDKWADRGKAGHFVVMRVRNRETLLTPKVLKKMKAEGERHLGKEYDMTFEWSDEKMYCSELVWKIYKRGAGLEIGCLSALGSFDLSHPMVRDLMKKRYGKSLPLKEPVLSPADMMESDLLERVYSRN